MRIVPFKDLTDNKKIEVARYYLTRPHLSQREVSKHFLISVHALTKSLSYYQSLLALSLPEEEIEWDPKELQGRRDDSQRFERLIKII